MLKPFLTANWRYLAMLNFAVDPQILAPHVPAGTQLDFHNDKTYLSVVGFLSRQTSARFTVTDRVLHRLVENSTPIQPDGKQLTFRRLLPCLKSGTRASVGSAYTGTL